MNKVKKVAVKVKNHVVKHKLNYTLGAVIVVLITANGRNAKKFDAFLIEKGINPMEFWLTPEDYKEVA